MKKIRWMVGWIKNEIDGWMDKQQMDGWMDSKKQMVELI